MNFGIIGQRWGQNYKRTIENHFSNNHQVAFIGGKDLDWKNKIHDVDTVIISTPPKTHGEIIKYCLKANKDCIIDKPLCIDNNTSMELLRYYGESTSKVLINHTTIFDSKYLHIKKTLVNNVKLIHCIIGKTGRFRPDVNALWDWLPHPLAIFIDIFQKDPHKYKVMTSCNNDLFSIELTFNNNQKGIIYGGRLLSTKMREVSIFTDDKQMWYDGNSSYISERNLVYDKRYDTPEPDDEIITSVPNYKEPMINLITEFLTTSRNDKSIILGDKIVRTIDSIEGLT